MLCLLSLLFVALSNAQSGCVYSSWITVLPCPATCTNGATFTQVRWIQSFAGICTDTTQRSLPCGPCSSSLPVSTARPPPPATATPRPVTAQVVIAPLAKSPPPPVAVLTPTPVTSTPASNPSNPSGCPTSCNDGGICLTNYYRRLHGAPPLSYSTTMQSYAEQCASKGASTCILQDCATGGSGSNAYELLTSNANASPPSICAAITAWYNEVSMYVYSNQPWSSNRGNFQAIGHFSQLVWKSTKTMGCGWRRQTCSGQTCFFLNCNYFPPGNVASDQQFLSNVS